MTNDGSTAHHHVIAMRVELRPQNLDIGNTAPPERPQYIPNENVLDDTFAESRMREVTIFARHTASSYRE